MVGCEAAGSASTLGGLGGLVELIVLLRSSGSPIHFSDSCFCPISHSLQKPPSSQDEAVASSAFRSHHLDLSFQTDPKIVTIA